MRLLRAFFVGSNLEVQSGKSGGPILFRNNRVVSVCVCEVGGGGSQDSWVCIVCACTYKHFRLHTLLTSACSV